MDKSCIKDHVEKVRRIICDIGRSVGRKGKKEGSKRKEG